MNISPAAQTLQPSAQVGFVFLGIFLLLGMTLGFMIYYLGYCKLRGKKVSLSLGVVSSLSGGVLTIATVYVAVQELTSGALGVAAYRVHGKGHCYYAIKPLEEKSNEDLALVVINNKQSIAQGRCTESSRSPSAQGERRFSCSGIGGQLVVNRASKLATFRGRHCQLMPKEGVTL